MVDGTCCGLKYAVKQGGRVAAFCALTIRCGTRDEATFPYGIAHFTEHTVFKGTEFKKASQINSCLDRLGGDLNAFTTKEEIVLHAASLKEDLPKAISLLLELAFHPIFPARETATEKGVVIDEIMSYKDSPADDVYDTFEEKFFAGHPLSRPILGTPEAVEGITPGQLSSFVRDRFTPENTVLTVVSPDDENAVAGKIEAIIAGAALPAPGANAYTRTLMNATPCIFNETVDKKNNEANAVFGGPAPSVYSGQDRVASILLANIIAGPGADSILNKLLREKKGWVYAVESNYSQYSDNGLITISLGCDKENLDKCSAALRKELDKLIDTPLSPRKLAAAKKQIIGQMAISGESGEAQCLSMGKSLMTFGHIATDGQIRQMIGDVGADNLQRIAAEAFSRDRMSVLMFV